MSQSNLEAVAGFYDGNPLYEWNRQDRHPTEFAVTQRVLQEHLPTPPARLLDIGGGPGRYTIWLAKQGYDITLLDLSEGNLKVANEKSQEAGVQFAMTQGTATNLAQFDDERFDAALLLGPLYHLKQESERQKAVDEAKRILKPDGVLFAAFLNRFTLLRYFAKYEADRLLEQQTAIELLLEDGVLPESAGPAGFGDVSYWTHPAEIEPFMVSCGFQKLDLVNVEGVIDYLEEAIIALEGPTRDAWMTLNHRLGKLPELHALAIHLVYVGRKTQ
ncbi:methyltransferase domain-containing protein [Chloroflexi bacterium TSY]|nr:methyltransferase domain-containing protein [Chloroflexi bacterium TSY]